MLKSNRARVTNANEAIVAASAQAGHGHGRSFPPGTPGLTGVGAWVFDEGTGTVAHDSADGHDGILVGGPTWTSGHTGAALQFNGSTSYVDTNASILDTTGNYNVAAWVKIVAGVRALAPTAPAAGTWSHLVGVRDAAHNSLKLYVDGSLAGRAAACQGDASTGHTVIGAREVRRQPGGLLAGRHRPGARLRPGAVGRPGLPALHVGQVTGGGAVGRSRRRRRAAGCRTAEDTGAHAR